MTYPVSEVDFYSDAVIRDPYPFYAELRAMGPVVWLAKQNAWALTHYAEVVSTLQNPDLFSSGHGLSLNDDVNKLLIGSTLNSDAPRHDQTRAITATPINRKAVLDLEPFIRRAAEGLAETLVAKGRFDAVNDLAAYLPLTIVTELVGLPDAGRENMLKWASATFNLFDGFNARSKAAFADLQALQAFLAQYGQRDQLRAGGLARRIFDEGPKHGFTEGECAQLMRDYINPSLDTTISATGYAAYLFATNPDQWDLVRADPTLVANAIEEVVRLSTPIRAFSRYVAQDTEIAGVQMAMGDRVLVVYASANRDGAVFADPDRFDVTRNTRKHVGFGHGKHLCMGLHLARLEMLCLIEAFAARVDRWDIVGEGTRAMNNTIHAFASLPVQVTPVANL